MTEQLYIPFQIPTHSKPTLLDRIIGREPSKKCPGGTIYLDTSDPDTKKIILNANNNRTLISICPICKSRISFEVTYENQ